MKKKELNEIEEKANENEVLEKKTSKKQKTLEKKNETLKKDTKEKGKLLTPSFNIVEVIVIMILVVLMGILLGSTVTYVKLNEVSGEKEEAQSELLDVYDELLDEYYSEVNPSQLSNAAIKGMLEYLGDPYSRYLSVEESNELDVELEGKFVGMGAKITTDEQGRVYVLEVFEDGPAEKAGILVGDVILKVDGEDVSSRSIVEISELIKGKPENEKVSIELLRGEETVTVEFNVAVVSVPSVYYSLKEWNDKQIAIIQITTLAKNSLEQFEKVYSQLEGKVDGIVIDVRDNSGGLLSSAKDIASLFLEKSSVVYQLETKGNINKILSTIDKKIELPVVFVVNGATASAAEVLIGALRDNVEAKVVGVRTFGKGTVQKYVKLSDNTAIKYTNQLWLTPNGTSINEIGFTPDFEITLDENYYQDPSFENDNQLKAALDLITK